MDRSKLYRRLVDNNSYRAAQLAAYKNQLEAEAKRRKEAERKVKEERKKAQDAKAREESLEAKDDNKKETPAIHKWDKPAGNNVVSSANNSTENNYEENIPESLKRQDEKTAKKEFGSFLARQRKKMFDTVALKNMPRYQMYTGIPQEDAKVNAYKQRTDARGNQAQQSGMQASMPSPIMPADYSIGDWFSDAYGTFGSTMNQAQYDAAAGEGQRANEVSDLSAMVRNKLNNQQLLDDINEALKSIDDYYSPQKNVAAYNVLEQKLNNSINKLKQYYPDIDVNNFADYQKKLLQDRAKLFMDIKFDKAEQTLHSMQTGLYGGVKHPLRQLGVWLHEGDDKVYDNKSYGEAISEGFKRGFNKAGLYGGVAGAYSNAWSKLAGTTSDWFGDRTDEALDQIAGWETADRNTRIKMLDNLDKQLGKVKQFSKTQMESQQRDKDNWDKEHKVSDYFQARALKANQDMQNGASIWTADNLLYGNIQQLGFSASSWDKQAVSMALSMLGGGSGLLAKTALLAGAAVQYQSGADENNAQVIEDLKTRIRNSMEGAKVYDAVMKEGRKKYKDLNDDEILDKITHGEWIPNNSKALASIKEDVENALIQSRKGINATYQKDMMAVASDAAFDAGLYSGKLAGGLGAKISKSVVKSAKYRLYKLALSKGVSSAYGLATEAGLGVAGGVAAGGARLIANAATSNKVGKWVLNQGKKLASKVTNTEVAKKVADSATKMVEFGRNIPLKLLSKVSPEAAYMTEKIAKRVLLGKEKKDAFGKIVRQGGLLNLGKKAVMSGYSEAIEEGKQYQNGLEWIKNANPDQVISTFDLLLKDTEKGYNLMTAAAGIPFGAQWGMATDGELYSNMAGGWLGGALHTSTVSLGQSALGMIGSPNRISIANALCHNALLDSHDSLTRYSKGANLAKRIGTSNPEVIRQELNSYAEYNQRRKELGLSYVDPDVIKQEQDYLNRINTISRLNVTKEQAKAAGIKVGSEQYHKFVSALALYGELSEDHKKKLAEANRPINSLLNTAAADIFSEQAADFLDGIDSKISHPIIELFRQSTPEQTEAVQNSDFNNKNGDRRKGESKKEYQKRKAREHKEKLQAQAEKAEQSAVGNNTPTTVQESDESIFRRGLGVLAEIAGLTDQLNTIDTLDKYADKRKRHDVRCMKERIQNRIDQLKKQIDPAKIDEVLKDPSAYFEDSDIFDQLKDHYQSRMSASIEHDVTDMMQQLLTGKAEFKFDPVAGLTRQWNLSSAKDVIDKLDENIDNNYKLVDEVNKEFESRNFPEEEKQPELLEDTEESAQVDESLAAAEAEINDEIPEDSVTEDTAPETTKKPYTSPTTEVRKKKKSYESPSTDVRKKKKSYSAPTATEQPSASQPEPQAEPEAELIVSVEDVDEAIDDILSALQEDGLMNAQTKPASNPKIIQAGIKVMMYNLQKGSYKFEDAVIGTYETFKERGVNQNVIDELIPYFKQWYGAAQFNPEMSDHFDEFDSPKDLKDVDVLEIIAQYENANLTQEEQDKAFEEYKNQLAEQNGVDYVFESTSEALSKDGVKNSQRFIIVNPDTKQYAIFQVTKVVDGKISEAIDVNGILFIKDGVQLTQDQIQRLYDQASNTGSVQDKMFKALELQIEADNENVVGVTGHDYFIKESDGKVYMYPRVHTILGDQYEEDPAQTAAVKQAKAEIEKLIDNNDTKALEELLLNVDNYQLYLDQLNNGGDKEYIIEALSQLVGRFNPGFSVEVGNVADEIVRIFFDDDTKTLKPLNYNTLTVKMQGKEVAINKLMTKETFGKLISSLNDIRSEYENLGYKISTKKHTWHAIIQLPNGQFQRVAGETDLVAVDKNGKFHILDTKTSKYTFGEHTYPSPSGPVTVSPFTNAHSLTFGGVVRRAKHSTKIHYSRQLSTYMLIMQKAMPQIQFAETPLEILPINVEYNGKQLEELLSGNEKYLYPIHRMDNGLKDEPSRIILDVQEDIINGSFNNEDVLNSKIETLKGVIRPLFESIKNLISECAEKANDLSSVSQEHADKINSLKEQLTQFKDTILSHSNLLMAKPDATQVDVVSNDVLNISDITSQIEQQIELITQEASQVRNDDQSTIDQRKNDYNQIVELYNKAYQQSVAFMNLSNREQYEKLKDLFDAVILAVEMFEQEYDNVTEFDAVIKPAIQWFNSLAVPATPAPKPQQIQPTSDGMGWKQHNTADRELVQNSKASDGTKLSDVTANADFETNSVCEVVGNVYTRRDGTAVVPVVITYNGKTFSTIEIQIAENAKGSAFIQELNEAIANKQSGLKVVLTGMNRTAGIVKRGTLVNAAQNGLIANMDIYDVSTEYGTGTFGLSKRDKDSGRVRVLGQGNTASGANQLYIFQPGRGTEGAVFGIITPAYDSNTTLVTPIINTNMTEGDAKTLAQLISKYVQRDAEHNDYNVTLEDGTESKLPLSVEDLIQMFLPIGQYDGKFNKATYVSFSSSTVTFTGPGVNRSFDVAVQASYDAMVQFIKSLRVNVDEGIINSRLGEATSGAHPFGRMATWFSRHPECKSVTIGQSRFRFGREDFKNPSNPSDRKGISGLGWMIKNGMFLSDYEGVSDPRFSFDHVEISKPEDEIEPTAPAGTPELGEVENDFDVEDAVYDDDYYNQTQIGKADTKIDKDKVVKRLHRIFGKDVPVKIVENIYDMYGKLIPGVVGRLYSDVILLCERAADGTELHEAFHKVSVLILPKSMLKLLYKGIRKAMAKRLGSKFAEEATDRQLEEYGANECQRFLMDLEDVNPTLKKPLEFIKWHYNAFKNVGSFRMYLLYIAMNNGVFRNMKSRKTDYPNYFKFEVHGRSFNTIVDNRMYDTLKRSMLYYIMYAQKIRKDGKNIDKLDLSNEIFDVKHEFKKVKTGKDGKPLFDKDGKVQMQKWEQSIREMLMASCKTEIGKLAIQEAIDNWDVVKLDVITQIGEFGIDYRESQKQGSIVDSASSTVLEDEESALAAEEGSGPNWLDAHMKDANESSRLVKATSGIRFFASMIKRWTTDKDGNQIEARNELGMYEFMDSKEVLSKILSDCHEVKSPSELVNKLKELSRTDKMYVQIYKIVNDHYRHQTDKEGNLNANTEQFITQLFNLIASYKMEYKRISANKDRQSKQYAFTVESCGQDYEARQTRRDWGRLLTYGGTPLFTRNQQGHIAPINENSVRVMGSIFDKLSDIRLQFSQDNIRALRNGAEPTLKIKGKSINITKDEDLMILKRSICDMLLYIGIEFSVPEFDFLLKSRYGETTLHEQLYKFFNETKLYDIANLWTSENKFIVKNSDGTWRWNITADDKIASAKAINAEDIYVYNSFCSYLSDFKYKYNHESTDLSVLVSKGDRYYCISENNMISDITDELAKNGPVAEMLSKYCYNYTKSVGETLDGTTDATPEGSIILKLVKNLKEGSKLPLKVCTLVQFKTNEYGDDGSGYFDISEREDYAAKAAILESGGLIFPTMSDKKSWCYIEGISLPGIEYGTTIGKNNKEESIVLSYDEDEVLEQLVEYADTEYYSIMQTMDLLKTMGDEKKVVNFHKGGKGVRVKDSKGVQHSVAQGTLFSSLTGVYDEEGNYISFTRLLDENGNFISPEENVKTAEKYFYSLNRELKKKVIAKILDHQTKKELEHLELLGLVKKNENNPQLYDNVGLNRESIEKLAIAMYSLKEGSQPNFVLMANATERYVRDLVSKSIMSILEVERVYSGHPAFFKFGYNSKGQLTDRSVDEFKRLGGLISTGTNNNTEIVGAPEDGMYVAAEVNNDEVGSEQIDEIKELMSVCEWRQAYRQLINADKEQCAEINKMDSETLERKVKELNPTVHLIISNKIKQETSAYEGGIDVADGGAYISPQMTEWLLRMCGEFDRKVQKAFEILKNPKSDIATQAEAYKLVTTKVIGALKYTAYGMRLSEDGKVTVPYYNKMALFPVFKCISTGRFAKLYDLMDKQGVHMLMINSAVKVGSQGSIDYSSDDSFRFNTYKQQFKYLRKQFNTNPHHKEDQAMGTQMVKVALSSLVMNNVYTKDDGTEITGDQLLSEIMKSIKQLSKIGRDKVRDILYNEDGTEIDPEKFSKFLNEQLSSRDADKSILDSISLITKGAVKMLKHPLAAISRMGWLQSILVSYINKRVVDVNTQGNAFYQRSIWNMEGEASQFMNDDNLPKDINGGKNLKMIIEDGPAKGAMDCVLTMDYFAEVLKEAGLQNASFEEQRNALIHAGIIGENAKANFIGYRIPTQAQSSIHPLRCVDVIPVIQHNIILPKEFTRITGSDFDIDKVFIGSLNFNLKSENGTYVNDETELTEEKKLQNDLIKNYVTVLKDPNGVHIAHRSIDNDTELLKDVLKDLESGRKGKPEVEPYDFYCLRTHTESKNDFLTGKTGIGPFALNNNSQILTMLYGVRFNSNSVMEILDHNRLDRVTDDHQQSILSWISALINAHVDIAKDPYISRLNVNQMTYNLTNLLVRTGYGKNSFYFLTQPIMFKMAEKYRQAQGKFMQEEGKSSFQIRTEAKLNAALELCGKKAVEEAKKLLYEEVDGKEIYSDKFVYIANAILNNEDDCSRMFSKGEYNINETDIIIVDGEDITPEVFQAIVYFIDKELERPAQAISDLVKYSKIDTKKQGKTVSEQIAYLKGVQKIFGDQMILKHLYNADIDEEYAGDFDQDSIQRMYVESFIQQKTHDAIFLFMDIIKGQVFEATPGFQNLVDRIAAFLGKTDATSIQKISDAVSSKIKADAINQYAEDKGIDIPGLVSGSNTIYDRLNKIKCGVRTNPELAYLVDENGEFKNPLLKLLIADKHWTFKKDAHMDSANDKFDNLKFVRLFDALDMGSAKTDYIIQAWDDLLNDSTHPQVLKFAEDLCVYAFVTSGDHGGRTKMFQYVPNSFREKSGYIDHIRTTLERLKDPTGTVNWFNAAFIDDVVLNNSDDYAFVPTLNISNENYKEGDVKWVSVKMNRSVEYNNETYVPGFPIFVTADNETPMKADDVKPYVKVKRAKLDGSSRDYTILKLATTISSDKKGYVIPVYVKVNPRGYTIEGGYKFFEYGSSRTEDPEYFPSINNIINTINTINERLKDYEQVYGSEFIKVANALYSNSIFPLNDQSEQWGGLPKNATYKPQEPIAPINVEEEEEEPSSDEKEVVRGELSTEVLDEVFEGVRDKEIILTDEIKNLILKHITEDKITDHGVEMYPKGSKERDALIKLVNAMYKYYEKNNVTVHMKHAKEGENNPAGGVLQGVYDTIEEAERNPVVLFTSLEGNNDWLILIHEMLHGITTNFSQWDSEGRAFDDPKLEAMYNLYVEKAHHDYGKEMHKIMIAETYEDLYKIRRSIRDIEHATTSVGEFISSFISYKAVQVETKSIKVEDHTLYDDILKWIKNAIRKIFGNDLNLTEENVINTITEFLLNADLSLPHGFQSQEAHDRFYNGMTVLSSEMNEIISRGMYVKSDSELIKSAKTAVDRVNENIGNAGKVVINTNKNYVAINLRNSEKMIPGVIKNISKFIKQLGENIENYTIKKNKNSVVVSIKKSNIISNFLKNIGKTGAPKGYEKYLEQLGDEILKTKCTK